MIRRDDLLAWMRRPEPPAVQCGLCFGSSGHPPIEGDGAPTCYPCILKRGRWAMDPDGLSQDALTALWSAHEDVIALRACRRHVLEWQWVGWTEDRDRLVDEGAADRVVGEAYKLAVGYGL